MELTPRQRIILKTIVEQFTSMAEPIGSKSLLNSLDFQVSSATVRNEMAALEKMGLLEKTHTSSGRIPSQKGYRYYVENLMEIDLDPGTQEALRSLFSKRQLTLEEVLETSCSILSDLTHLTSVVLGPDTEKEKLIHLQLIPVTANEAVGLIVTDSAHTEHRVFHFEGEVTPDDLKVCSQLLSDYLKDTPLDEVVDKLQEVSPILGSQLARYEVILEAFVSAFMKRTTKNGVVHGRANMLCQPEFTDIKKVEQLMRIMEDASVFRAWTNQKDNVAIPIDTRNKLIQIGDCSVVSTSFRCAPEEEGQLMVVGPSRMPYAKVIALMDTISNVIEESLDLPSQGGSKDQNE